MPNNFAYIYTSYPDARYYVNESRQPIALYNAKIFDEPFTAACLYNYGIITNATFAPRTKERNHIDFYYIDTYGNYGTADVKTVSKNKYLRYCNGNFDCLAVNDMTLQSDVTCMTVVYDNRIYVITKEQLKNIVPLHSGKVKGFDNTWQLMHYYNMTDIMDKIPTYVYIGPEIYSMYSTILDIYKFYSDDMYEYGRDCRKNGFTPDQEFVTSRLNQYAIEITPIINNINNFFFNGKHRTKTA